jgi:hypothetical protein
VCHWCGTVAEYWHEGTTSSHPLNTQRCIGSTVRRAEPMRNARIYEYISVEAARPIRRLRRREKVNRAIKTSLQNTECVNRFIWLRVPWWALGNAATNQQILQIVYTYIEDKASHLRRASHRHSPQRETQHFSKIAKWRYSWILYFERSIVRYFIFKHHSLVVLSRIMRHFSSRRHA